ncbi:RNA polymerase subunit Rpo13 [Metallosphaera yellowstonensis]|uniref:RNA polymerase subunit Rpo13 n=1 Tax=Metallosphaera yellowstonensis TaxID=1111107 RepID=UPI001FDFC284|nr:RNA polymerase subunit Rpo13 [Metallosphaera yellowstonensis]
MSHLSEDFDEGEDVPNSGAEEIRGEDEEEGVPAMSLQDIELLSKNTEVWYKLISGKIGIEEAKRLFEENSSTTQTKSEKSKASKKKSPKKSKSTKKSKGE